MNNDTTTRRKRKNCHIGGMFTFRGCPALSTWLGHPLDSTARNHEVWGHWTFMTADHSFGAGRANTRLLCAWAKSPSKDFKYISKHGQTAFWNIVLPQPDSSRKINQEDHDTHQALGWPLCTPVLKEFRPRTRGVKTRHRLYRRFYSRPWKKILVSDQKKIEKCHFGIWNILLGLKEVCQNLIWN